MGAVEGGECLQGSERDFRVGAAGAAVEDRVADCP